MLRKKRTFAPVPLCNRGKSKEFAPLCYRPSYRPLALLLLEIWTTEEDNLLRELTVLHGDGNWTTIAESLTDRTPKQCRERFHNHLADYITKAEWNDQEDQCVMILQKILGNQWARVRNCFLLLSSFFVSLSSVFCLDIKVNARPNR
jgi:hypothetical protein